MQPSKKRPYKTGEKANAIEKSLRILLSFAPQNKEFRTTDLSQLLGYNLATVSRTLQILKRYGFVDKNPRTKLFRLGPTISKLAAAISRSMRTEFIQIAKPHADLLCETVGSTVTVEVLSSKSSVIAYIVQGVSFFQVPHEIGEPLPAHCSAGSKAILAFSSPETVAGLVKEGLRSYTENTITDPIAFQKELDKIRKRGYAVDRQELHVGVVAVAAPIFSLEGEVVAAINVAGPKHLLGDIVDSTLSEQVKSAAQKISSELYHDSDARV